ncbi:MAG TPA: 2-phospho-L-lactate guanylyltransferase [Candidatus Dormibacteraeota bacterium]|nr:2-phospho-L-lactate guanylyltransferase [Candidatus Dormibacteraeota bacterium]
MISGVVPIKSFASAKTRLGGKLDAAQRASLARASAIRVLTAMSQCAAIDQRIAVVEDEETAFVARNHRFETLLRPDLWGQSAAVEAGFDHARRSGAATVLTVSADVPLTRAQDVDALLKHRSPVLVMVSNLEGEGTNAMRLSPAQPFRLHFGPGSLEQHRREADQVGLEVVVLDNPRLRIDIDTPDDLDALEKSGPDGRRVFVEAGQFRRDLAIEEAWATRTQRS